MEILHILKSIVVIFVTLEIMRQIIIRLPWLFAIMGIGVMGYCDYLVITDLIKSYPPQTFLNGAELFCFLPFCTIGVLFYAGLFYMSVTGQLKEGDSTPSNNACSGRGTAPRR